MIKKQKLIEINPLPEKAKIKRIYTHISGMMGLVKSWVKFDLYNKECEEFLKIESWKDALSYSVREDFRGLEEQIRNLRLLKARQKATDAEMDMAWSMWQVERTLTE